MSNIASASSFPSVARSRSICQRSNVPFYIYAPDYRHSSGGIRVLHYLCHILNEMGEEAYVVGAKVVSPRLRTPQLTFAQLKSHFLAGQNPVTLYPEVVSNNPLNTPLIVRWLLNVPGNLGGAIAYEPNDLIYYYESWCLPPGVTGKPLFIHSVDHHIFNNDNNPDDRQRVHECVYANKYFRDGQPLLPEHQELLSLGQEIKRSPEEIAAVLRKAKVLYCYEPSGLISEALSCGCPVLLVRSAYWQLSADDPHHRMPGCAVYGEDQAMERARQLLVFNDDAQAAEQDHSWELTRLLVESIYAAAKTLETEGKPLANETQVLWDGTPEERAKDSDTFTDLYGDCGLYFPDREGGSQALPTSANKQYKLFLERKSLQEIDGQLLAERMHRWVKKPCFNIVLEVWPGEEDLLANTIDCIAPQWYPDWHLTIVAESVAPEELSGIPQITWVRCVSGEQVATTNRLLGTLPGDWLVFLETGCTLEPHSLLYFGDTINHDPAARLVFCDEDKHGKNNALTHPRFKPGFNLEMLRAMYYLGPCLVVEKTSFMDIGGLTQGGTPGLFDLALKVCETWSEKALVHISEPLVHTPEVGLRPVSAEDEQRVVREHLLRQGIQAEVDSGLVTGTQKIVYQLSDTPLVSIIIPTHDQPGYLTHCVESLLNETDYPNIELILVNHQTQDPDALEYLRELRSRPALAGRIQILENNQPFNYAALCNQGAAVAAGEHLLFLDNDTEFVQPAWLSILVAHLQQSGVAAVSPRLSSPDGSFPTLNQTARILGMGSLAESFAGEGQSLVEPGYFGHLQVAQEVSALSGSCFLIRREIFSALGCFNAVDTPVREPVLEICLRLRQQDWKLIWTPWANVVHRNQATRKRSLSGSHSLQEMGSALEEQSFILSRYMDQLAHDPYYHRHFSLEQPYAIEPHAVIDWDNRFHERLHVLGVPLSSGSGEYRMSAPFRVLQKKGLAQCCTVFPMGQHQQRVLTSVELARAAPDTLMLQNAIDDLQRTRMGQYRQFNPDVFMTYAVDDVLGQLPKKHYLYNFQIREGKSRLREGVAHCDRLITSTEPLAEFCKGMIQDIVVVPNRLEGSRWLDVQSKRRVGRKPRVGWAGAQQHLGDLELIRDVVEATHEEVEWVFMGMCPAFLSPFVHESHDFVAFSQYPAKLASLNLDLAIAPLEQVLFNEGKSNLRLLEYGIMGWPVVCTDIYPYQTNKAPVKRVNNQAETWIEAIRERINDLDAAEKEGDRLREWVLKHYILEDHLQDWLQAITPR